MHINDLTHQIIGAAMCVHDALGPGLLESTYEACLTHELRKRGHIVQPQLPIPVRYDGVLIETGYRADLVIDGIVIVELKAVGTVLPIHEAQLLTYLRHSECKVGLLFNFHEERLSDGIRRKINGDLGS